MSARFGVGVCLGLVLALGVLLPRGVGRGPEAAPPQVTAVPPLEAGKRYRFSGAGGYQDGTVRELSRGNWVRIEVEPAGTTAGVAWVNLANVFGVAELPQGNGVESARAKIKTLTEAVRAYEVRYKVRPDSLEQLLKPPTGSPLIGSQEMLTDPWGQPFRYGAAGLKNQGLKAHIWSDGQDPNDKTKIIGNWPNG